MSPSSLAEAAHVEADALVLVTPDSLTADALTYVTAVLLLVDELGEQHGWGPERRTEEVQARLKPKLGNFHEDGPRALRKELRGAGLPAELARVALSHVGSVDDLDREIRSLARTFDGPDAGARVAHLTRLARDGRILPLQASWVDPAWPQAVNRALEALDTRMSLLHLGDGLSTPYVLEQSDTFLGLLDRLDGREDAQVTLRSRGIKERSGWHSQPAEDLAFQGEHAALISELDDPRGAVFDRAEWSESGGTTVRDLFWHMRAYREAIWSSFGPRQLGQGVMLRRDEIGAPPLTREESDARIEALRTQLFQDPADAKLLLARHALWRSKGWRLRTSVFLPNLLLLSLGHPSRSDGSDHFQGPAQDLLPFLGDRAPSNEVELREMSDAFLREHWSDEKNRLAALRGHASFDSLSPSAQERFLEFAREARDEEDLQALSFLIGAFVVNGSLESSFHAGAEVLLGVELHSSGDEVGVPPDRLGRRWGDGEELLGWLDQLAVRLDKEVSIRNYRTARTGSQSGA